MRPILICLLLLDAAWLSSACHRSPAENIGPAESASGGHPAPALPPVAQATVATPPGRRTAMPAQEAEGAEALQSAIQAPVGAAREAAIARAIRRWSAYEPEAALDALLALPASEWRTELLGERVEAWTRLAPEVAVIWALETLPAGEARATALSQAFGAWAEMDPAEAALNAARLPAAEHAAAEACVGAHWPHRDPAAAAAWSQSLPAEAQERLTPGLVAVWADQDAAGAEQWLRELPMGRARDLALAGYAQRIAEENPHGALDWIAGIGSEPMRLDQLELLAATRRAAFPGENLAWLERAPLSAGGRRQLAQRLATSPRP